ncbi:Rieske 2Fe-2S domain-containing protein [Tessaracoccus sp. MC1679]|uniref:cytochrome bc1 complex Rieske iron-sulfur subunit n=1 Tax=unclassified Tessaracoccus TaxID=2635419 RepID=UPI0016015D8C|nr:MULTISPECIES: Rieske 2Fe-2S domain-containing protein [unclassified Tessaracoccus]MBB1512549.1 Rieske 2Fe-2S domain-containing protein [Tessaracoccus sp. MC1627]MBB1516551.1 Rieske 2Fe-2S domain-containing protein [Tessaracoccus sp. MC1679]
MSHDNLPVRDPELGHSVANPGLEEHVERYADADKGAGNRAYTAILLMLGAVPLLSIAFIVIYFAVPRDMVIDFGILRANAQNVGFGLTGGLSAVLIGVAVIQWARVIMDDREMVETRHSASSSPEEMRTMLQGWDDGVEQSGVRRRKLILGALGGAVGMSVVPLVVLLADMGPHPTKAVRAETIEQTIWAEDVLILNDENWLPIRPEMLEVGQLVNAQPATLRDLHGVEAHQAKAKSSLILVRMDPNSIQIPESRRDWHVSGILAYSKICTHVGCPISLWERQTHHLLCPCHQSTFDLGNSGVVVFGPAARSLPQLAIKVNADGYLVAQGDFTLPVGPSFFERDSSNDFKDGDQ